MKFILYSFIAIVLMMIATAATLLKFIDNMKAFDTILKN